MKTQYVDMSIKTQEALAHFRMLFEYPFEDFARKIISFGFTVVPREQKFKEKILNLTWSLAANFKYVYPFRLNGGEDSSERLLNLIKLSHGSDTVGYERTLAWLYQGNSRDFSVRAINFEEGTEKLFQLGTEPSADHPADNRLLSGITGISLIGSPVLIRKGTDSFPEGDFYSAYVWSKNKSSGKFEFVNIKSIKLLSAEVLD